MTTGPERRARLVAARIAGMKAEFPTQHLERGSLAAWAGREARLEWHNQEPPAVRAPVGASGYVTVGRDWLDHEELLVGIPGGPTDNRRKTRDDRVGARPIDGEPESLLGSDRDLVRGDVGGVAVGRLHRYAAPAEYLRRLAEGPDQRRASPADGAQRDPLAPDRLGGTARWRRRCRRRRRTDRQPRSTPPRPTPRRRGDRSGRVEVKP